MSVNKWFQDAVNAKPPYTLGGWNHSMPESDRRELALASRSKKLTDKKRYLSAARALQALANVTADKSTKDIASSDAKYFFQMANQSSEKMSKGGGIPSNYGGRSAEEVWNSWNRNQRIHFVRDHWNKIGHGSFGSAYDYALYAETGFDDISFDIKQQLGFHIIEGQYEKGGDVIESLGKYEKQFGGDYTGDLPSNYGSFSYGEKLDFLERGFGKAAKTAIKDRDFLKYNLDVLIEMEDAPADSYEKSKELASKYIDLHNQIQALQEKDTSSTFGNNVWLGILGS